MRYIEMPLKSTLFPLGAMPMYSPWWVAWALQWATTLSLSAMRSSMVLSKSGKPLRTLAASCLASSTRSGAKSSCAASRLPVWFQSSTCSRRTTASFSSVDTLISSFPTWLSPTGPPAVAPSCRSLRPWPALCLSLAPPTFDDRVQRTSFLGPGHHVSGGLASHFLLGFQGVEGGVRGKYDVRVVQEGVILRWRLLRQDIQGGPSQRPLVERPEQIVHHHQAAPGGVDQVAALLHPPEQAPVYEPPGLSR